MVCINAKSKMQLTTNFNLSEFNCKDGTPVPPEFIGNAKEVASNLQVLRDEIKSALHINSGYRSNSYNASVGGVKNSQHLTASAADITSKNHKPKEIYDIILKLIAAGKMRNGGLGLYDTFVHYDIGGANRRWDFRKHK